MNYKTLLCIFLLFPSFLFSSAGDLQTISLLDDEKEETEEVGNNGCCFINIFKFLSCIGCIKTEQQKKEERSINRNNKLPIRELRFSGEELNRMAFGKPTLQHSKYGTIGRETTVSV
jgi:hypothetical protein